MITWFRKLNIQGKLFVVFGAIALVGSLAVALNVFMVTLLIGSYGDLENISQKQQDAYLAQDLVQCLESAENNYLLEQSESELDRHDDCWARLGEYARTALLAAGTDEEKSAIIEMDNARKAYDAVFYDIVDAVDTDNSTELVDNLFPESYRIFSVMYAKSQILIDRYDEMQTETDDRSTYIETGAFITGVAALLVFLALAVIAAAVITFQVNRPLQVLAQATTEAQTGQYAPEKAGGLSGRKDEIGQLARGFAKMVAALGDREAGLKQQVEELRQKLENSQM